LSEPLLNTIQVKMMSALCCHVCWFIKTNWADWAL